MTSPAMPSRDPVLNRAHHTRVELVGHLERRLAARHESGVVAALAAAQDAGTVRETERLTHRLKMGRKKPSLQRAFSS